MVNDNGMDADSGAGLLAVGAKRAAAMIDVSLRHWRRMDATGRVPAAVLCGRAKRWLVDDLKRWMRAGCPDRAAFEREFVYTD